MAVPDIRLDEKRRRVKDKPCLGKMALRDGQKLIERSDNAGSIAPFSRFFLFFQMILFLQGASHAGKTTFAKRLARLTGASVVSLDLLKMGLIKSGNSDFAGLTPEDDEAIAERLWPIVREMARVADENGQSLIIEGVSLPVVEAGRFAHGLGKSRAAAFAIVFSEKYIRNHYELICQKASASERRVHQDPPALIDLLSDHASIRSDAINNGWTLLEIDSPDVWERKIGRQQDFPAEILKALAA